MNARARFGSGAGGTELMSGINGSLAAVATKTESAGSKARSNTGGSSRRGIGVRSDKAAVCRGRRAYAEIAVTQR